MGRALVRFAERFEPVEDWFVDAARREGKSHPGHIGPPADAEPSEYTFGKTTALPLPELDRYRILLRPRTRSPGSTLCCAPSTTSSRCCVTLRPED